MINGANTGQKPSAKARLVSTGAATGAPIAKAGDANKPQNDAASEIAPDRIDLLAITLFAMSAVAGGIVSAWLLR